MLELSLVDEVRADVLSPAAFRVLALRDGLVEICRASFPAGELTLAQLTAFGEVELAERVAYSGWVAALLRPEPEMLILLYGYPGYGQVAVAGKDREAVEHVVAEIVATLRDREPRRDDVPITFWAHAAGRAVDQRRSITAPSWAEIRANYHPAASEALDNLMAAGEPGHGGLLLWHGQPGTGKSYALRALAREWRDWCDTHVISDADAFLGGHTSYLLEALMRTHRSDRDNRRWRLIVLEDAGELLAADARAVAGQALSRLLNVTDGLLGSGLRALVLVTTNEPLQRLHPAVVRPGRTWAEVEFPPLPAADANAWLEAHDSDARVERDVLLAELFALTRGGELPERPTMGFAA